MCVTRLHSNILHHPLSVRPKSQQQVCRSGDSSAFNRSNNNQKGLDTKRPNGVNWPSGIQALGWYISADTTGSRLNQTTGPLHQSLSQSYVWTRSVLTFPPFTIKQRKHSNPGPHLCCARHALPFTAWDFSLRQYFSGDNPSSDRKSN